MRRENRVGTALVALGACAFLAGLPGPAVADEHCDEKQVEAAVDDVAAAASRIKKNLQRDWDPADKESPRHAVLSDLMTLQHQAVALVGLVRAGEGRDKTEPVFRRMQAAVKSAREDAAKFPEVEAQQSHIAAAEKAIAELEDCYGPE